MQSDTLWFYLCKIQKQVKLINGVRSYDSRNTRRVHMGKHTRFRGTDSIWFPCLGVSYIDVFTLW